MLEEHNKTARTTTMNSLFTRKKNKSSMLITLRTHYAPTEESEDLASKRQAQQVSSRSAR
jgi:hypothetical protein